MKIYGMGGINIYSDNIIYKKLNAKVFSFLYIISDSMKLFSSFELQKRSES